MERLRRLEQHVRETDTPPVRRPRDVAQEQAIAQVAEEGIRSAMERGVVFREAITEAFAAASADLQRRAGQ